MRRALSFSAGRRALLKPGALRALSPLLFVCACSASPPAPLPPAPSAAPTAAPKAPAMPWLELTGTEKATMLVGRGADGSRLYETPLGVVHAVAGAPGGGAFVVVEEPTQYSPGKAVQMRVLLRLEERGFVAWRARVEGGGWDWHLFPSGERLYAFDLGTKSSNGRRYLHVLDAARGERLRDVELEPDLSEVDGRDGVIVVAGPGRVTRLDPEGAKAWSVRLQQFPSLDLAPASDRYRKVAVAADGTVLTGASDGSLVALDAEGKALYQLGVRGAVSRIEARAGGDFLVTSSDGLASVIGSGGVVRGEGSLDAPLAPGEPAPSEGGRVVDLREGKRSAANRPPPAASSPAAPPWTPTAAYRARREGLAGKPFRSVLSVVAAAPDDVWALAQGAATPGSDEAEHLIHYDGRAWSDHGVPSVTFAKEVFAEGQPAEAGRFVASTLARGPGGALLVIGKRYGGGAKRLCVLERVAPDASAPGGAAASGAKFRERRELFAALAKIAPDEVSEPSYAASPGGREVLCNGEPSLCVELGRGVSPRPLAADQGRALPGGYAELRSPRGLVTTPVLFAGETLWKVNGWASGEGDVWGLDAASLAHWNGAAFESRDTPLERLGSVWASARDDLWLSGARGVARFDGARWWRILGLEGITEVSVTGSARGDVWVFGRSGLWHVTPEPQSQGDLEGVAALPPPAAAPSAALTVAGADPSYRLERLVLEVDGGAPLRAALSIAEGPGGVIWLHDGARVIEHDGARSRVLYKAPKPAPFVCWSAPENDCEVCADCTERGPKPLECQSCVAPSGAGEGVALAAEGWLPIRGGRATPDQAPLAALLAVAAAPSGSIWAVSAQEGDVPRTLIQSSRGLRLVTGLPPAAYAGVAVRADDEVWMAGGLTTAEYDGTVHPAGEGTLVRFDGRTFTRHRGPDGALLAVAAAGAGEAWAVGLAGGVIHVKGSVTEAFHLEREAGVRLPVLLRGVAASGPNEVWIVGDSATLLRWDGKALRRVEASAAGKQAALSAVIAPGAKPGWVVGPGGIWRVVKAP